jgi:hypothetical protein
MFVIKRSECGPQIEEVFSSASGQQRLLQNITISPGTQK